MKREPHDVMRLGTILPVSYPQETGKAWDGLASLKKLLADEFFDAIEVGPVKSNALRKEMISMIDISHIEGIAYGGQSITLAAGLNINDLDDRRRGYALAALKEGIDEAIEFGASHFAFLAGRYDEGSIEDSLQALEDSTAELCIYAARKGLLLVEIEVFDHAVDKRSLIGPTARTAGFARRMAARHSNFRVQIDSSHIPLLGETLEESILPVLPLLSHVHMGNAVVSDPSYPGYGDTHPRFGFPGGSNDTGELADYLRILLSSGFLNSTDRPIVSFEVRPRLGEDPDLVLAGAKRTLLRAWSMVQDSLS